MTGPVTGPMTSVGLPFDSLALRQALSRHRALLAAGLAAGAVATSLGVLAPHAPATVRVVAATRDLPAGQPVRAADLVLRPVPRALVPAGALTATAQLLGRTLAAPVRRGETLTDLRLAGAGLLAQRDAGLLAVPVRLADAAATALLHAGDRVDVLAAASAPGAPPYAQVVAPDTAVLAVPAGDATEEGALVVLAATPSVAARLAAAAVSSRLSIAVRGAR